MGLSVFDFDENDPSSLAREAAEGITKARKEAGRRGITSFLFHSSSVEEFDQRAAFGGVSESLDDVADLYLGSPDQRAKLIATLRREFEAQHEDMDAWAEKNSPRCNHRGCMNDDVDEVYDNYGIYAGRYCDKHRKEAPGQWDYAGADTEPLDEDYPNPNRSREFDGAYVGEHEIHRCAWCHQPATQQHDGFGYCDKHYDQLMSKQKSRSDEGDETEQEPSPVEKERRERALREFNRLPRDGGPGNRWKYQATRGEFAVCPTCRGKGSHVNPSIDSQGLSQEDFDEDPDFYEDYMGGAYDVPCAECRGARVVPQCSADGCNEPAAAKVQGAMRDRRDDVTPNHFPTCYEHHSADDRDEADDLDDMYATMEAERRMGA